MAKTCHFFSELLSFVNILSPPCLFEIAVMVRKKSDKKKDFQLFFKTYIVYVVYVGSKRCGESQHLHRLA